MTESQEGPERPTTEPYGAAPYGAPPAGPGTWQYAAPNWNPQVPPPYPVYPPYQPAPRRHGRAVAALAGVALIAAAGGVTVGHAVWHSGSTAATATAGGQSGTGGGTGTNPFGSTGGNGNSNSGQSGTGSGGGSGGTGQSSGSSSGSGGPSDVSAIAQKVDPALVDVNSTFSYQSAEGAGTGIVLTSNGEILTNNHVINGATSVSVTDVGNGKTYTASVVGYDDAKDIAVLQLQGASGLTTANLGDSGQVAVGQSVVAIGNAGGVGGTPNSAGGSVTALNQAISASDELDGTAEQLSGLIEVNADVQSGDSGGSLVNASGQVVGMDTAASESYSLASQSAGAGYAIPIDSALSIARQIEAGQASTTVHVGATAFLGVLVQSSSRQSSGGLGSGSGSGSGSGNSSTSGAVVSETVQGGAAAQAGLTAGDVITSLDGQSVSSAAGLTSIMGTLKPGQSVSIGYTTPYGQAQTGTVDPSSGPPA